MRRGKSNFRCGSRSDLKVFLIVMNRATESQIQLSQLMHPKCIRWL